MEPEKSRNTRNEHVTKYRSVDVFNHTCTPVNKGYDDATVDTSVKTESSTEEPLNSKDGAPSEHPNKHFTPLIKVYKSLPDN